MTTLDCTDCYLTIAIGDGVKRALVRHFARFLGQQLATRGIAARGEPAHDKIDREAWRLTGRVLNEIEAEIDGAIDETLLAPNPQQSAQDILATTVQAAVSAAEQDYLTDEILGFAALQVKLCDATCDASPARD